MTSRALYHRLKSCLHAAGFDLIAPFRVDWYNAEVPKHLQLPVGVPECFAVVIGNTRRLWDQEFTNALRVKTICLETPTCIKEDAENSTFPCSSCSTPFPWPHIEHPFDTFVENSVTSATTMALHGYTGNASQVNYYWAHETAPGRLVAIQKLGKIAGLADLNEITHLSVHPTYGPWISWRSVLVFPMIPFHSPGKIHEGDCFSDLLLRPRALAVIPESEATLHKLKEKMNDTLATTPAISDPSLSADNWRLWLAVRDTFPVGRTHRFSVEQIEYHYTKNRNILANIAASS